LFDYTGCECKSCGKKFTSEDDIVVCPECGTPYHRDCWKKEGKCINSELHESHKSWKEANETEAEAPLCKKCGNRLAEEQLFCDKCGAPTDYFFSRGSERTAENAERNAAYGNDGSDPTANNFDPFMINYADPLCGFNPDEKYDDTVTVRDMGDFVGSNTRYYLPKFRNMKNMNMKLSINFPAMFFPELYFAYRKMPLAAALVLIFRTIVDLPAAAIGLQSALSEEMYRNTLVAMYPYISDFVDKLLSLNLTSGPFLTLYNITNILQFMMFFFFAGFSNYLYYRHAVKKCGDVKLFTEAAGGNLSYNLKLSGGVSAGLLILFIVLEIVMQFVSYAAVIALSAA
jgi:hypothetical protein